MTDHEGNGKIYLAGGIQEGLETVTIARGEAKYNSNFLQARRNPESKIHVDVSVARGMSHYLFYYIIICLLEQYMPTICCK